MEKRSSIELRIQIREIGGRSVAELFIHPDLFKFVIQRIRFSQIMGVTQLSNEIGGPHKRTFFVILIIRLSGTRKAVNSMARAILAASRSSLVSDAIHTRISLTAQHDMATTRRRMSRAKVCSTACRINDVSVGFVAFEDPPDITNVMQEAGDNQVRVIAGGRRCNRAIALS